MRSQTTFTIGCIVLLPALCLLAATEIPFKHTAIDTGVKNPWAKIVADIDGDGFPDLVVGGQNGPLVWYRYPNWTKTVIAEGGYRTVDGEAGDIDGDGRVDVVLSPSELKGNWYRLSWFEAPADPKQGGWAEHVVADPIECVIHGLVTADFNGDGAVDIAASEMHQGEDPDEVMLFINRGKGAAWDKQVLRRIGMLMDCFVQPDVLALG